MAKQSEYDLFCQALSQHAKQVRRQCESVRNRVLDHGDETGMPAAAALVRQVESLFERARVCVSLRRLNAEQIEADLEIAHAALAAATVRQAA